MHTYSMHYLLLHIDQVNNPLDNLKKNKIIENENTLELLFVCIVCSQFLPVVVLEHAHAYESPAR